MALGFLTLYYFLRQKYNIDRLATVSSFLIELPKEGSYILTFIFDGLLTFRIFRLYDAFNIRVILSKFTANN